MSTRIAGIGCVTPLGCEPVEVWAKVAAGERPPVLEISNPESGEALAAAPIPPAIVASFGTLNREPRLRRASAISLYAAAAGRAAIQGLELTPEVKSRLAVVFGVSSGGVQYTRRFYEQVVKQGASAASPLLFPETVYNAPASHLAAMLGVDGASYTLVGDCTVGLQAVQLGQQLIEMGNADHVLVVASEELDWILIEGHRDLGLVPREATGKGTLLAEGAAAVLLGKVGEWSVDVATQAFCEPSEAGAAIGEVMRAVQSDTVDVLADATNSTWVDTSLIRALPGAANSFSTKHSLGEAIGCSSLLQVVLAIGALKSLGLRTAMVPSLGWNQHAAVARIESV